MILFEKMLLEFAGGCVCCPVLWDFVHFLRISLHLSQRTSLRQSTVQNEAAILNTSA